jgi:S-adenosylhomocysteine hydrolase
MKVKELIAKLGKYNEDFAVIVEEVDKTKINDAPCQLYDIHEISQAAITTGEVLLATTVAIKIFKKQEKAHD